MKMLVSKMCNLQTITLEFFQNDTNLTFLTFLYKIDKLRLAEWGELQSKILVL